MGGTKTGQQNHLNDKVHSDQSVVNKELFLSGVVGGTNEAGPPNHFNDQVDSDQLAANKELSLSG